MAQRGKKNNNHVMHSKQPHVYIYVYKTCSKVPQLDHQYMPLFFSA
jgi:hypothetical protein